MNQFTPFRPEEIPTSIQKQNGRFAWEFYSLIPDETEGSISAHKEAPRQIAESKWYDVPHSAAFIALHWGRPPFVSEDAKAILERCDSVGGDTFRIKDVLPSYGLFWDRFTKTWIKK